jgi:hypothetical protein
MGVLRNTPEYAAWVNMRNRCNKPSAKGYAQYGARGIKVCKRWQQSFANFLADMGYRPSPAHQLDRIDNAGPYSPENCRWSTRLENCNNRRDNVLLTYNGETLTIREWERRSGFGRTIIWQRINHLGWSVEKALTTPVRPLRKR